MLPVPYDRNRPHYTDGLCMKKKKKKDFCPLHFPHWQQLTPPLLYKHQKRERKRESIITNEPLWVFPVKFTWKEPYWFVRSRQMHCEVFSPPHLHPYVRPPAPGVSCLFISIQLELLDLLSWIFIWPYREAQMNFIDWCTANGCKWW